MLTTLRIKNLALVDDLTIELSPGFNAITGETGAGKSILIGALTLALGERADRNLIRSGADSCAVEAVLEVGRLGDSVDLLLREYGVEPCQEGQLLIKRGFTVSGANRQFINGSPVTLAVLKQLGELLVDIHGPHDHQSLLQGRPQLELLDAYAGLQSDRAAVSGLLGRRVELEARKTALITDEQTYARRLDLLRHQVAEIEAARFEPGEEEVLEADHARASNAAQLLQLVQGALAVLDEQEGSLIERGGALGRILNELHRIDAASAALVRRHEDALELWRELQSELGRYADRVEVDPARLAELEERLNLLQSLKRKYGGGIGEINRFGAAARDELRMLESRDAELARLQSEETKLAEELRITAGKLTARRLKQAPRLAREVTGQLRALGFARSEFSIALNAAPVVTATGADACEFLFAPNVGEPPRPLRAIASSGELARVMLAVKTVLAAQDRIPVLVFDEVDANVGGETAAVVGRKMAEIGQCRQVLCVTHLPAVAAAAGAHFEVRKRVEGSRTLTVIERLGDEARAGELARMLGGQSAAARRHAAELLNSSPLSPESRRPRRRS